MELQQLTERIRLPQASTAVIKETLDTLLEHHGKEMEDLRNSYLSDGDFVGFDKLDAFAEEAKIHFYTASLAFLFFCALKLKERYEKENLPEDLFFDAMCDLKYKNDECLAVKGITGTFVRDWFLWFFRLKRFALGRFQYEEIPFSREKFTVNGLTVLPEDTVINVHIPYSGVPITEANRLDSYKKAYKFYKNRLDRKEIPFICYSWLLYSKKGFFPENGNIYAFQNEFHIIETSEDEYGKDVWRLFLTDTKDYSNLPEKSSLQRHLKKWLTDGKKFGEGVGVFFFDGEKII